jgi:hypothetical protein
MDLANRISENRDYHELKALLPLYRMAKRYGIKPETIRGAIGMLIHDAMDRKNAERRAEAVGDA